MFRAVKNAGTDTMKIALNEHARIVLHSAREIVPFLHGDLHASGRVSRMKDHRSGHASAVVFGSSDVVYALVQHENLTFKHAPGRMAKYLEIAMREEVSGSLSKRIASVFKYEAFKRLGK